MYKRQQVKRAETQVSLLVKFQRIYSALKSKRAELSEKFQITHEQYDVDRQFGLTRFNFEEDHLTIANQKLLELFSSSDDAKAFDKSILWLAATLVDLDSTSSDFHAAIAVTWILGDYRLIQSCLRDLCSASPPTVSLSLFLIHLAALAKLSEVTRLRRKLKIFKDNYTITVREHVGLSYVQFTVWMSTFASDTFYQSLSATMIRNKAAKQNTNLSGALEHANLAIEHYESKKDQEIELQRAEIINYLYAVNLIVYFVSIRASEKEFQRIGRYVDILEAEWEQHGTQRFWQARFDDTLGAYYARKAQLAETEVAFNDYLSKALLRTSRAYEKTIELRGKYHSFHSKISKLKGQFRNPSFDYSKLIH